MPEYISFCRILNEYFAFKIINYRSEKSTFL
jgi:hypothetical protein